MQDGLFTSIMKTKMVMIRSGFFANQFSYIKAVDKKCIFCFFHFIALLSVRCGKQESFHPVNGMKVASCNH